MSNSGGKITAPVSIEDVCQVLGVTTRDVGYLCSNAHGKTNRYSMYKPIRNASLGILTESDFKSACYGFGNANSNSDITDRVWSYLPPKGGSEPYRLVDFNKYNHNAPNFCSIALPTTISGTTVNKVNINARSLNGNTSNGTLGIQDIYPTTVKFWGVKVKFVNSGKVLWSSYPIGANIFCIIPQLWRDLITSEDGYQLQITQFFSDNLTANLIGYTTTSPESLGYKIYPVFSPNGEATTINVSNYGGVAGKMYVPNDGNMTPHTFLKYTYTSTQWWTTVVKDIPGIGMGRLKSMDAYMIGVSSKIVNGVREYKTAFEYRIPLDDTVYAKFSYYNQSQSANIYTVELALNMVFPQNTFVQYYIFFTNRNSTTGYFYVELDAEYTQK